MTQKNNDKKIALLIGGVVVLSLFLWVGISIVNLVSNSCAVYTYNPHNGVLKLRIGQDEYSLNPQETKKIDISEGNYDVTSSLNNEIILDTTIYLTPLIEKNGGLINLSGEPLYLWTEYYGSSDIERLYDSEDSLTNSSSPLNQVREQGLSFIQIDSTILYGDVKVYAWGQLVLEKQWDYDIDQSFEDEISTNNHEDIVLGKAISKLFDKRSLLDYWHKNYGEIIQ